MKWRIFLVWFGFFGVIIKAVSHALEEIQPEYEERKKRVKDIRAEYEEKEPEEVEIVDSTLQGEDQKGGKF